MKQHCAFFLIICLLLTGCSGKRQVIEELVPSLETQTHNVSVLFINAGRADSILVQVDDKAFLIDAGLPSSVATITKALEERNVQALNGVILTHSHKDHIGGLKKLSKKFDIPIIYTSQYELIGKSGESGTDKLAEELGITLLRLMAGNEIDITGDVAFDVLGPTEYNDDDDNDNSLVLRLKVNGKTILFAGDMQFAEEKALLNEGIDLKADVLKVGNHGNKDATSPEFGEAVSPEIAFVTTNTKKDKNSNHKKVHKNLKDSIIYVTEDTTLGYLLTIGGNGEMTIDNL